MAEHLATDEISIGDYVLTGGELAAMVVVDAASRFVPGVVGKEESVRHDSFFEGRLDYPQYTRPRDFRGMKVPQVLFSGDHKKIEAWRRTEGAGEDAAAEARPLVGREPSGRRDGQLLDPNSGRKEQTMSLMQLVEDKQMKKDIEPFGVGDTVKVHVIIKEGDKERIQIFQGDVIAKRGRGMNATFTVRKISFGIGVEKIFPLHSKSIKKVEIVRTTKVRRAKLYYLRGLKGKAARLREEK